MIRGSVALLVEDEALIAMLVEDYLRQLGVREIGVAHTLAEGLAMAREGEYDFAVLDININGEMSFPIADVLHQRAIPFVFATGYGPRALDDRFRDCPTLTKPYAEQSLQKVVEGLLAGR